MAEDAFSGDIPRPRSQGTVRLTAEHGRNWLFGVASSNCVEGQGNGGQATGTRKQVTEMPEPEIVQKTRTFGMMCATSARPRAEPSF